MPRRMSAVVLVLAVALVGTACGSVTDERDDGTGETYAVTHEAGTTVDVPTNPRTIAALDEYAALNMLDLGIKPTVVFGGLSSEAGAIVLESEGIDVTPAPSMILDPDFEAIAAEDPDLIVLTTPGASIADTYDRFTEIAPTIVLPYEMPWRDMLATTGKAFRQEERAADITAALESKLDEVVGLYGTTEQSMSILGSFQGTYFSPAMVNPMSATVEAVGLIRPDSEQHGVPTGSSTAAVPFSPEFLLEHDSDISVVLGGSIYDVDAVTNLPTFSALASAKNDRVYIANGELWSANFALGTWWVLDDLEQISTRTDARQLGTLSDAVSRWHALRRAIDD